MSLQVVAVVVPVEVNLVLVVAVELAVAQVVQDIVQPETQVLVAH